MKRFIPLVLIGTLLGLVGCTDADEEEWQIWDYAPYVLTIDIEDAQGNNLLDPAADGNITAEKIEMYYNRKYYAMYDLESLRPESRYYAPQMFGLRLIKQFDWETDVDKPWRLEWGEFDRAISGEYRFSFLFSDRNCEPYDFELKIVNKGEANVVEELTVNGKKAATPDHYTIVLP